jgi:hypothetical protein
MPRYVTMIHIDEQNAPTDDPGPEFGERMSALLDEITKAGVMIDTAGLTPRPRAPGHLVTWSDGKVSYTDGPFTETKVTTR